MYPPHASSVRVRYDRPLCNWSRSRTWKKNQVGKLINNKSYGFVIKNTKRSSNELLCSRNGENLMKCIDFVWKWACGRCDLYRLLECIYYLISVYFIWKLYEISCFMKKCTTYDGLISSMNASNLSLIYTNTFCDVISVIN